MLITCHGDQMANAFHRLGAGSFSLGNKPPRAQEMPAWRAMASAVTWLSPESICVWIPAGGQACDGFPRLGLMVSATAKGQRALAALNKATLRPWDSWTAMAASICGLHAPSDSIKRCLPIQSSAHGLGPSPRDRAGIRSQLGHHRGRTMPNRRRWPWTLDGSGGWPCRLPMRGMLCRIATGEFPEVNQAGFAFCDGAGLVVPMALIFAGVLQVDAARRPDAPAGRPMPGHDDGDGVEMTSAQGRAITSAGPMPCRCLATSSSQYERPQNGYGDGARRPVCRWPQSGPRRFGRRAQPEPVRRRG